MALSNEQITLIESSYQLIAPRLLEVGQRFYHHLFERYPELKPLFKSEISQQSMKLMQTIGYAVSQLHTDDLLTPVLVNLGESHVHYGVKKEHFAYVGNALMITLAEMLGETFTPEMHEAWVALYRMLTAKITQPFSE